MYHGVRFKYTALGMLGGNEEEEEKKGPSTIDDVMAFAAEFTKK